MRLYVTVRLEGVEHSLELVCFVSVQDQDFPFPRVQCGVCALNTQNIGGDTEYFVVTRNRRGRG